MSDYLPSFMDSLEAEGKSAFTVESYISDMEHFSRWFENDHRRLISARIVEALANTGLGVGLLAAVIL